MRLRARLFAVRHGLPLADGPEGIPSAPNDPKHPAGLLPGVRLLPRRPARRPPRPARARGRARCRASRAAGPFVPPRELARDPRLPGGGARRPCSRRSATSSATVASSDGRAARRRARRRRRRADARLVARRTLGVACSRHGGFGMRRRALLRSRRSSCAASLGVVRAGAAEPERRAAGRSSAGGTRPGVADGANLPDAWDGNGGDRDPLEDAHPRASRTRAPWCGATRCSSRRRSRRGRMPRSSPGSTARAPLPRTSRSTSGRC